MGYDYGGYPAYVSVRERAAKAARQIAALEKKGQKLSPVVLDGTRIAGTFWGKAWCRNLESYSDYANRLPRGRSYVRSGAVIDLQIEAGQLHARVQGSSLYTVTIGIGAVEQARWKAVVAACSGAVDSVVELLQGKLSKAVMEVISSKETGLFPAPRQIHFRCSCPDSASMCKHVAAVLYGVGARLDAQPELLFRLRGADPTELIAGAAKGAVLGGKAPAKERRLGADLADVFGIDLEPEAAAPVKARGKAEPVVKASPAVKAKRAPKAEPPSVVTITAAELRQRGVPPATVSYWVKTGVLWRTPVAGVYEETERSRERMARYGAKEGA
jgi:uncharacterized Zn finger protein